MASLVPGAVGKTAHDQLEAEQEGKTAVWGGHYGPVSLRGHHALGELREG